MNLPTEKDIRRDSYWFGDLYGMKVQQLAQQLAAEEEARKRQQEEDAIMAELIARQMGLPPRSQQPYATPEAQMPPPPVEGAPQRSFKEMALEQGVYGTQDPRNQARIKAMEELEKQEAYRKGMGQIAEKYRTTRPVGMAEEGTPTEEEGRIIQQRDLTADVLNLMGNLGMSKEGMGELKSLLEREHERGESVLDRASRESAAALGASRQPSLATKGMDKFDDKLRNDPLLRKNNQVLTAARDLEIMLKSGNPISHAVIGTKFARLSGEVGNLALQEQMQYKGSQAAWEQFKQKLQLMGSGTLTESNRKYALDLVDQYRNTAQYMTSKRINAIMGGHSAAWGISKSELVPIAQSYGYDPEMLTESTASKTDGGTESAEERRAKLRRELLGGE